MHVPNDEAFEPAGPRTPRLGGLFVMQICLHKLNRLDSMLLDLSFSVGLVVGAKEA